jgi:ATP-binding cassette subfamily B protein
MIAKWYGKSYTLQTLRERSFITREGVSMLGISDAAESIGFHTNGVKITFKQLSEDVPLPCILHWNQNHFVVCYKIKRKGRNNYTISISDPAARKSDFTLSEFLKCWISSKTQGEDTGTALLMQPGPEFYEEKDERSKDRPVKGLRFFARYLRPYKSQLWQLVVGMAVGSLLQMIFPFLTQAMVDTGIGTGNLNFITLILVSQLVLFATQLGVNFIRSWVVLHMNSRVNITLISDFLLKLMKLPMSFFDTKMVGDIMQRIGDHGRIQGFLTGTSLSVIFSFLNFIIFGIILAYYNPLILFVFAIGNTFYVLWILSFMRFRRELDHRRFAQASSEQSTVVQIVTGMQEIKLSNCEKQKRWQWERIQVKLFKISVRGLALGQYQELGSVFFSQATGIIISFIAAKAVVEGNMTLGMMMSQSYIIGQLSAPIGQFIGFAQSLQDAKISLERLNEIHNREDEEQTIDSKLNILPENKTFKIENLYFSYDGADRNYVIEDVNLTIPHNKITAIVGASGSGKTTLVKLLLGYYPPVRGTLNLGEVPVGNLNPHLWRKVTGAVMQEGFIFSDTIAGNIAPGEENIDTERLLYAVKVANIREFIDSLPLGYNTKIGMEGSGVSQGQKQRILIARAVYKNPQFLFFDEATNSLDANNEKMIMENLREFYEGKTVVIVAHRLSSVKNADRIIVLEKGKIAEQGTHEELVSARGAYYTLVKNQLELGN